jgi:M6 family metalloprotease-like protein
VAWTVPDGNRLVEHVAAVDQNGHLIVSWFDFAARRLTDKLLDDFAPLATQKQRRRLVVILWDPQRPGHPAPPRAAIESAFSGQANSVRQFFKESSLGRFDFDVVQFLPPAGAGHPDWYPAQKPADHYWDNPDVNSPDVAKQNPNYHQNKYNDGWLSGHNEKWAEAVWMAANDFNFAAFDFNGNGTLDVNDLLVCILIPQSGSFAGFQRPPYGRQVPAAIPLRSNGVNAGVILPTILEIYLGNPPHVGLIAHELSHILVGAADMYHGWPPESEYVPFTAGSFSLMATGIPGNLDPFHRLKYGWLRHRLALHSGCYTLRDAITYGEALVLMDQRHSTKEYFLLENRWNKPNTSDAGLPDTGLAVWHIIEDSASYNQSPTPVGVSAAYWQGTLNQWSRRGVRLLRPVVTPGNTNNGLALWDGSQPATGYDLLSNDPNPQHTQLRWVTNTLAGAPSGFAIRQISPAGPEISFDVTVPW